jgi:hypothetical protein
MICVCRISFRGDLNVRRSVCYICLPKRGFSWNVTNKFTNNWILDFGGTQNTCRSVAAPVAFKTGLLYVYFSWEIFNVVWNRTRGSFRMKIYTCNS